MVGCAAMTAAYAPGRSGFGSAGLLNDQHHVFRSFQRNGSLVAREVGLAPVVADHVEADDAGGAPPRLAGSRGGAAVGPSRTGSASGDDLRQRLVEELDEGRRGQDVAPRIGS